MNLESRYIVVKIKDANRFLSAAERDLLERLHAKTALGRIDAGQKMLGCIVVEKDWPEYAPTLAAISARVDCEEAGITPEELGESRKAQAEAEFYGRHG